MKISEFELELQAIDKDLSIRPNNMSERVLQRYPEVNNLASILYKGAEVCSIPNFDIFDEKNPAYSIDLRSDGERVAHRTRPEALEMVRGKLEQLKNDKNYADAFFGRGEYSASALMRDDKTPMLVEEVTAEATEVSGESLLEAPATPALEENNA